MAERKARVERNTLETQITVSVNLDGTGESHFDTGVPFLEHMMYHSGAGVYQSGGRQEGDSSVRPWLRAARRSLVSGSD